MDESTTPTSTPKQSMSSKDRFKLWNYVTAHYAESGLGDRAFAERAAKELGFPVNKDHIKFARDGLEIPSNRVPGNMMRDPLEERVAKLERALADLYDLLKSRGGSNA